MPRQPSPGWVHCQDSWRGVLLPSTVGLPQASDELWGRGSMKAETSLARAPLPGHADSEQGQAGIRGVRCSRLPQGAEMSSHGLTWFSS